MNGGRLQFWRRSWRRGKAKVYLLCLLWAALVTVAHDWPFRPLLDEELACVNRLFLWRGPKPPAPEIVILGIDQESNTSDTFDEETFQHCPDLRLLYSFPYKRRAYARAIERLRGAGAKVIALDLLFLQPTCEDEDQPLQSSIESNRSQVVIATNFRDGGRELATPTDVVPTNVPVRSVAGYDNYWPDLDQFVRRVRATTYESAEAGVDRYPDEKPWLSFAALIVKKFAPDTPIPKAGRDIYINFAGPPGTYPNHKFYEIFYDKTWRQNLKNGDVFRDKIVLIGPVGNFQHDTQPTPFATPDAQMDGVEIHASAIATLLRGETYHDAPRWAGLLAVFALGLLSAVLLNLNVHPLLKLGLLLGGCVAYFALAVSVFVHHYLVLWVATPLWTVVGCGVGGITVQLVAEQWEKLRVRRTLERYVSKPVADEILRHGEVYENSLGGERRAVTVLFADVRGFTSLSENADPSEIVTQLNELFTAMTEIIMKHHGTVSKFIGDEIMAIYGAPLTAGATEDAWRAVQTARDMRQRLAQLQQGWSNQHRPMLRMGVGVNRGEVLVGNIGSPQRMEYTVIGDPVNVASRVEKLNKEFGTDILLTESVYDLVKGRVEVQQMGVFTVRGRERGLNVYALKTV